MSYTVKEIYSSIQLEGFHHGRPAVFLRFTGCNLWSGLEKDRPSAICQFCDTDFVGTDGDGGGSFATARELAGIDRCKRPHCSVSAATASRQGCDEDRLQEAGK